MSNKASRGDRIPPRLFQILKDDAIKVFCSICQQIWKTQQWSQNWKRSFFIQSQRKAMTKNVQTTAQLHLFHMLARSCSKFSKPGFNSTWTKNFQMYKLVLEKAEEPEMKLPTSAGSLKQQENSRKTSTSASLTTLQPLTVWITTNWKILKEMGIPIHLTCLVRNLYAGQEAKVRTGCGTIDWFKIGKGIHQGYTLSPCSSNFMQSHHVKCWAGWSAS